MLVIRESQMDALRSVARHGFEQRLQRHLMGTLADRAPNSGIDSRSATRAALELGITSERDIARYGELMYRYAGGPDLGGLPPKARNILLAHGVKPADKLDQLAAWAAAWQDGERAGG